MRIQDILFWIIILLIILVALWLLSGSPPEINALISIALFVAASEILIWRYLFNIDKKTTIGFIKMRNDVNNINNKLDILLNKKKTR